MECKDFIVETINNRWVEQFNEIKNNGWLDNEYEVRPKWSDGTPAHTKAIFGYRTEYDLEKEFPIMSIRRQYWKGAVKELLWIYVQNSNNVNDLPVRIWDSWADETGSIGKSYGYQVGKKRIFDDVPFECSQIERIVYLLKNNPTSRRMYITLLNQDDSKDMALQPCCHTVTFSVMNGKLNAELSQRSGDFLAAAGAGCYNEIQYATLILMLAHVSGLKPGRFVHNITNLHVYDRHEKYCQDMVDMHGLVKGIQHMPKMKIVGDIDNFFDFTIENFELENYHPLSKSERIEIAV